MTRALTILVCAAALAAGAQEPAGDFTQGPLRATGITSDLAIDGAGFFILREGSELSYTREGRFRFDSGYVMVDLEDRQVLAFATDAELHSVDLSHISSLPQATESIAVNANLDPASPTISAPFSQRDPGSTANSQTGIRGFDSLGNEREILIYFRKTSGRGRWEWYAGSRREAFDMSGFGMAQGLPGLGNQFVVAQTGTLEFDTGGLLASEDGGALSLQYDADGNGVLDAGAVPAPQSWPWASGAASARIAFDFGTPVNSGGTGGDGMTQFGGGNFVRSVDQDGFAAGSLQSIDIDRNGFVTGAFSNGQTRALAQIALATFPGSYWLERIGDSRRYRPTERSGGPIIDPSDQAAEMGAIYSGFLEDLCQTAQRLCDEPTPLEACEHELSLCLAQGSLDEDRDGEPDATDLCAQTVARARVDPAGCSRAQFCSAISIAGRRGARVCARSDWSNDEPLSDDPRDCRVSGGRCIAGVPGRAR